MTWRRQVSVEPAADFGSGHGVLIVSGSPEPGRVIIERADRVIYVPEEWLASAAADSVPWAEVTWINPWHPVLKILGTDRIVIYDKIGSCGPRVVAALFEQPD